MARDGNMAGPGVDTRLDLPVQRASAPDAPRDDDDDETDDVEDYALVLTCDQLQQVDEFRTLLDRADDADKFELCAKKMQRTAPPRHETADSDCHPRRRHVGWLSRV